ncbi:dihydrolipoamide acetyltransferase family protein [Streptomyces caatingaensis]|uniref:Dihydrolipoamide acetyltransferase component of pyruvate dehydrogenase complex n=1 Tax=Streptomyces caatingaensis TaxID=1678637 RepID=A0A0K9X6V9_9ACTN|nr:dihydrolipoamide acetyltransferase family protein [Streptomyces caatingaensis]KNB49169.1 branched-chain alpha-keto acid dehydrogenase subunit E2 [Streptomyces caatingaensis]
MAVVKEFALPDLGEGLTEAQVVRWLVEVGDVVAVDQPVVEVETAKAMVEVPCPYGGVVTARFGEEGAELPVGAPLLTVAVGDAAGEAGPGPGAGASSGAASGAAAAGPSAEEGSGNVLVGYGTGAPVPRRARIRRPWAPPGPPQAVPRPDDGAVWSDAPVTGGAGGGRQAVGGAVTGGAVAGKVAVISPLVRRIARERGVDLTRVRGSGPEGLILRADVERAAAAAGFAPASAPAPASPAPAPGPASPVPASAAEGERIPLRGLRGAVAEKLGRSRREIPDASCWVDADATELLAARRAMNELPGAAKVSLLALLARICTAALAEFPELNSRVDTEAQEIVLLPAVHLGFAAQTPRGLVVPVVRDAHTMGAAGLSAEIGRLTEAAREGRITPAELTGGTFTLNNYGVFGVDGSTPIINHPEAAMLGVGRIVPKPWVHQGELAVRHVVQLSLAFDHRVCDGGTAGGFLRYVADRVERPAVLLRTL